MPLFSNKFSPRKPTPRKAIATIGQERPTEDLGLEVGEIRIRLGEQEAVFDKGEWLPETGPTSGIHKENKKLRKRLQDLQNENNLLKLKFEILLDMLTQTTAEAHLKEKQMEKLQSAMKHLKRRN
ncbi:protein chibby homolog 1 [Schistocerca gregaria]|uniref:protein chibby homolog 1 n=1 Tax=Schistocerca gregaria TaxID=7010 RepID=UPI00211E476C|nr:protein chibby homolog 1 [Schistocerca gregaria]